MASGNANKVSTQADQLQMLHAASLRREDMAQRHAHLRHFGIRAGFATLLGLMVLLGALGVMYLDTSETRLERIVVGHMTKIELATRMHQVARERTVALQKMILLDDPFERDEQWMQFNNRAGEFADARARLLGIALAPQEREILDRQGHLTGKAVPLQESVVELVSQGRRAEAHRLLVEKAIPAQDAVLEQLAQFYTLQKDAADVAVKQAYSAHQNARALLIVFSLALLGLGLGTTTMVLRRAKRADAEMRKLSSAVEQTADSVLITDAESVIQYVNRAYEQTTGYTRAEAIGNKPNIVKSGQHDAAFYARLWDTIRRGEPFRDIFVNRRKNGELYHEEKTITPLKNERGEITHFVSTGKDITERKHAEEALARSTSEWTYAMDFIEDALYLIDLDDRVVRANHAFYRLTGLTPEQALGRDITALMHPRGESLPCPVCAARRERHDARVVMEADHPDNPTGRPIEVTVHIVRDREGAPVSVLMGIHDLTRTRQMESELRRSQASLLEAQRMAHLGNWDWNVVTNELAWSEEVYRIFGVDPQQYAPSADGFLEAIHPEDREFVRQTAERALHERQKFSLDFRIQRPDGGLRIVHEEAEVLYDAAGTPLRLIGTVQDITERRQAEERLSYLAHYDVLTGMPNRTLLLDRLHQSILDADRVERIVAVMFLDLDRFKVINDTLGHHVGDGLLKAVAERLKTCLRPGDTIARIGGDEFTIVLANVAHVDDVARVARKILESFAQPFGVNGHELFTTTSIGITLYPFDVHDAEGLLKNADAAMYHAKESGRNTLQFFTAELNQRAERRLALEIGLRQALEKNQLSLHYQPQVDVDSGRITGMEALLRWKHPQLGDVSPVEFIPVAEETGLILPIGDWVLREACRQTKAWHETGFPPMQIAVNLSGKQLLQKDFTDQVRGILQETNLAARYLDLELTESLLMTDAEGILDILHVLHDLGISFSVDDFGTGYSSLAYLKRFPIDILKIDRSFVRDLATDPNDVAIVKTIIAMAHTLGMRVVAEGVETRDQLEFLRGQGCDGSQGYYCSAPLSAEEFSELLTDWHQIRRGKCDFRPLATKKRKVRQAPRATARAARGPARRIKK